MVFRNNACRTERLDDDVADRDLGVIAAVPAAVGSASLLPTRAEITTWAELRGRVERDPKRGPGVRLDGPR